MEVDGVIIPARCAVEVTFSVHQHRHLLRPDEQANEILLGCFGRAYHRYPGLNLNVLKIISTHGHFIALPTAADILSEFMRDFLSDAGTRINILRNRKGTLWERRYRAIPILDEAKMDERFRYVLNHGTKENLVWSAKDWPGVSSVSALMGGPKLVGRWLDGTATGELEKQRQRKLDRAAARGNKRELPTVLPVWRHYPIDLVPMPHWENLRVGQRRARVAAMVHEDEIQTALRHKRAGTKPCGVKAVLATDPFSRPSERETHPAPVCHASTGEGRSAYRKLYKAFLEVHATVRDRTKATLPTSDLPQGATLPPLCYRSPRPPAKPQPPLIDARGRIVGEPATGPPATGPPST